MEKLYQDVHDDDCKHFEEVLNMTNMTNMTASISNYSAEMEADEEQLLHVVASSVGRGRGSAPDDDDVINTISNTACLPNPYYSTVFPTTDEASERLSIGSKRQHETASSGNNSSAIQHLLEHDVEKQEKVVNDAAATTPAVNPVAKRRYSSKLRRSGIKADEWHQGNNGSEFTGIGGMSNASGMSFGNSSLGAASGFSVQSSFTGNTGPRPIRHNNYSIPSFSPSGHHMNPLPAANMMPFPSAFTAAGMRGVVAGGMTTNSNSAGNGPAGRSMQGFGMSSNSALNSNIPANTGTQRIYEHMLPQQELPAGGDQQQQQNPWSANQQMASNFMNYQATCPPDYRHPRMNDPAAMGTYNPNMLFAQQQQTNRQQQQQRTPITNANSVPIPAARSGSFGTVFPAEYMNQFITDTYSNNCFAREGVANPSAMPYYHQTMQSQGNNMNFAGPNLASGAGDFQEVQQHYTAVSSSHGGTVSDQHSEQLSTRKIMTLESDEDSIWLSQFLCFLRKHCCEVFTANEKDVKDRRKSKQISVNQVGIRCRFCAHLPHRGRAGRSSCYPSSATRIYQSVTMMIREHFPVCDELPEDVRREYTILKKNTKKGEMESKQHWQRSARKLGMVDTPTGIYFEKDIM